ncbi:beta-lactamase/transpeptidase-like protein [Pyrenochaeta sp. MPI-SDFR-AT-0127]|nr:beta-lactamase/transpeptidase-like protein [Pyrenochaeta sp. MPI-SDFR-AT-0127]
MDPLSIAAAASSLVFSVVRNGRALATVFEKYQDSQQCIFMMQTECTVLAAALSQLQMIFSKVPDSAISRYPDFVMEALDLSLVGCTLTLSVLNKEIGNLVESIDDNAAKMTKGKRLKYLWKEESMNELLQQLRGQSSALSLLLKALDSSSIEQILTIVQSGQPTFQKVRNGAESIRRMNPQEHYAESVMDMTFDDTKTIYSLETSWPTDYDEPIDSISTKLEQSTLAAKPTSLTVGDALPDGWKTGYSAEYDQWYFINTATRISQWERPIGPATAPQNIIPPQPTQLPSRKPVLSPNTPITTPLTVQAMQPVQKSSRRAPEPSNNVDDNFDFAPWKINTNAKFEAALDNLRREASVPALAVGVVSVDSPPKIYVIGNRKQKCPSPVTRADCFTLANTNIITTTLLAILIDRGVFRWEESVVDLFPSLASRAHPFHHQTTLGMLAAHHSGLTSQIESVEDGDLFRYIRQVSAKKGRFAVAMSYLGRPPDTNPGTTYSWNWANPILIALALEERTSSSLQSLVKTLIFDPLEMYSAGFGRPDAEKNSSMPANPTQPWGHRDSTMNPLNPTEVNLFQPPALVASTGIHCSTPDYASFVSMHLRVSMGMPTQILHPESASRFYTRFSDFSWTLGGWAIASREWAGGEAFMDNGRCDGFSISTWLAPLKGKAYFAIANVDGDVGLKITDNAVGLAIRHAAN